MPCEFRTCYTILCEHRQRGSHTGAYFIEFLLIILCLWCFTVMSRCLSIVARINRKCHFDKCAEIDNFMLAFFLTLLSLGRMGGGCGVGL